MSSERAFERLRAADPVPQPLLAEELRADSDVLLSAITERMQTMQIQEEQYVRTSPPQRPNVWLVAAAIALVVVAAVALANLANNSPEPVATTMATEFVANPLPTLDQWAEAMNEGDLDGALALLSSEASCDLPTGSVDTCEDHLGYLIAIGTHFEKTSCREAVPYRCFFDLTSQLHATMGYPDYSLPMMPEVSLDENGHLVADFFGNINTNTPYIPLDAADLWAFMREDYPELNIGLPFGPDPYTAEAGEAAMEAATRLNDPERVIGALHNILSVYAASGIARCSTQDGTVACQALVDFFEAIGATLDFECAIEPASNGEIPCALELDSMIHDALGGGPSQGDMTVVYRGGRTQALSVEVLFAADPAVHGSFMEFAVARPALADGETGRPLWTADTGAAWVAAAEEFASG